MENEQIVEALLRAHAAGDLWRARPEGSEAALTVAETRTNS